MRFASFLRPALLALLLLSGSACSSSVVTPSETEEPFSFRPEPPPTYRHAGVRLATLNAEFLFDGEGDEGQATFPHKGDPAKARAHRDRVGALIAMLDADVVMLQEVENERVLELLLAESLAGRGYRAYFVEGNDTFTGQDVALLARVPVEAVGRTDERAPVGGGSDTYGVSKNLWVHLALGGQPTTLIGLHFLARPDEANRRPQREAQAEVVRRLVAQELGAGRAVAVLGDFNDYDEATRDLAGSTPISRVLATIKAAGPGASDDLHNVLADVPPAERFTSFWDKNMNNRVEAGELTAIDHVLLSPALRARLLEVTYVQAHDPTQSPDHFPVVVTLRPN